MICFFSVCLNGVFCYFVYQGKLPESIAQFLEKIRPVARKKTKDKMLEVMEEGEERGCINSSQRKLVENVFEFKERSAQDLMIHRRDVVMLSIHESHEEILHQIIKTGRSRFPVYDQNSDDVVGVLATRKYLLNYLSYPKKTLADLLYPGYFVPTTVRAERLLRDMQSRKVHIAILVDEYGGVAGIVTLEDLLEEIVGNIYDEFDPQDQEEIIPISENLWRVAGNTHLDKVAEILNIALPLAEMDFDTVSGLIYDHLDMIPEDGRFPRMEVFGLVIQVEQIVDRRIVWVTVSVQQNQVQQVVSN